MIEIKNIEKSFGESKILKEFQLFLKLEKQSNHWPKWVWKNSFIKKLYWVYTVRSGNNWFDGRVYGSHDEEEENFVPK
jgi:ABC-type polar amino acid transport system ATPase subunit